MTELSEGALSFLETLPLHMRSDYITKETQRIAAFNKVYATPDAVLGDKYECYARYVECDGRNLICEDIVVYEYCRARYFKILLAHTHNPIKNLHIFDKVGICLEAQQNLHKVDIEGILYSMDAIDDLEFDLDTLNITIAPGKTAEAMECAANVGGDSVELKDGIIGIWWD